MQIIRCLHYLFSLTLTLTLIKDVSTHPTPFLNPWRPPPPPSGLMQMRRTASGIPISYRLDTWSQYDNPEEGAKREGDMYESHPQSRKTTTRDKNLLWPNGLVKYYVHSSIINEPMKFAVLEDALNIIMKKTCIKFVRIHADDDGQLPADGWVNITGHQRGCFSDLGRRAAGFTGLNLDVTTCFRTIGHSIHEMLHTLGMYHEHMRPDRDNHITIIWENIKEGDLFNFDILNENTITNYGLPYDYESVMHYSMTAFSKNRTLPTIIPKTFNMEIGQRSHLSHYDIQKLLITYNCNAIDKKNMNDAKKRDTIHDKSSDRLKSSKLSKIIPKMEVKTQAPIYNVAVHNSTSNRLQDNEYTDSATQMDGINRMIFVNPAYLVQPNYPTSLNLYPLYSHIHFYFCFDNR